LAKQARGLRGAGQLAWLDRLDDEYGNIFAALNWAQESGATATGLHVAADLERFWVWRAHLREPSLTIENLLAQPVPAEQIQAHAQGHRVVGLLQWLMGNHATGNAHAQESERLCLLLGPDGKADLADAKLLSIFYTDFTVANDPIRMIRQRHAEVLKLFQKRASVEEKATLYMGFF
jgi:hypothetical protein